MKPLVSTPSASKAPGKVLEKRKKKLSKSSIFAKKSPFFRSKSRLFDRLPSHFRPESLPYNR
jgi:hypothetical protein